MQLLSNIKFSALEPQLKSLKTEQQIDLVVGAMDVSEGVLLLLFSHRFNKEVGIIVTETSHTKGLQKVLNEARDVIHAS